MLLLRSKLLSSSRLSPLSPTFSSAYLHRLFVSAPPAHDSPSPPSHFAVQYLIKSCGLPSEKAARASRYLAHLKSQAVLRDARFLCFSVEKCLHPRMAKLQEIGFSPSHISLLLSISPQVFKYTNLQQKVLFWLGILSSIEELLGVLKVAIFLLSINLETISANLSFLKDQCGLSASQIVRLIKLCPRLITSTPQTLKSKAKRAEKLGFTSSSGMFLYALLVVNGLNRKIVDARMNNFRILGFSQDEVTSLVKKQPVILTVTEDIMARKVEFLIKEAGCDKGHLLANPTILSLSLKKRLIPRSLVRNVLKLKGCPVANRKVASFKFVEKFVLPYEPDISGLLRAYEDACAGNKPAVLNSTRNLSSNGLSGSLSDYFGNLDSLVSLDLSRNDLSGSLPNSLDNLTALTYLDIRGNNKILTTLPPLLQGRQQNGSLTYRFGDINLNHQILLASASATFLKLRKYNQSVMPNSNDIYEASPVTNNNASNYTNVPQPNNSFNNHQMDVEQIFSNFEYQKFSYNDLKRITNGFKNKIGTGGFGSVYLGHLDNGFQVAVKMHSQSSKQGIKEFLAEAENLARVHHKNLVTLLGYSIDKNCMALVYEYMQEGNLHNKLKENTRPLTWKQRLQIAYESALGLEYLHKACNPPLIHRDVKTNNILLSAKLEAKIADFGLSRIFNSDSTSHVSTGLVGTPGYLDPE